jgi:hypothetical protein
VLTPFLAEVQTPVIANSDSTLIPSAMTTSTPDLAESPLSPAELYQLTLYKWRYSLEAFGFATEQARELMFLKWLHASRRVLP